MNVLVLVKRVVDFNVKVRVKSDNSGYDWTGRTGKRHRTSIRALLGFRPFSVRDVEPLRDWL